MFYYINKNLSLPYISFETELLKECFNIGTTIEDFEKGYYVKLNEAQIKFAKENPNASSIEIFKMQLMEVVVNEPLIEEVKQSKIQEITLHDNSNIVNNFKINGIINAWFTVAERNNYCASINAAKTVGLETLTFFVGNTKLEISTAMAEIMLAQIQLYADQCFIVTKQHIINVETLTSIEDINNYDYTVGYPEQLNFQLD